MNELPERVKSWIGRPLVVADVLNVQPALWQNFCAAIEDGNPLYWDADAAREHTGGIIAPPAMLAAWTVEPDWYPGRPATGHRPLEVHFMLKEALGYPYGIVVEAEFEYHEPVRAGDSLRAEQRLLAVGDEKDTRLGRGRDWSIAVTYFRQDGVLVGVQTFRFLGYRKQ